MVLRELDDGVVAIGQPSHAWISGQLARAWGKERFGSVCPWEEVCLEAEQHDVGIAEWDLEPELDPALVWAWDSLSLALLLDWAPHDTDPVPTRGEATSLRLAEAEGAPRRFTLDPWPFARERVVVRCEGRRLDERFANEVAMRAALES